ncbi:MAG: hypothetical protein LBQ73_07115, partial [Tannerellaceae bacterium]|nr:hypothetical protein [Tannerellaceae bacterium]
MLDERVRESGLSKPFPRWTGQFYVDRRGKIVRYPYHKAGTHSITFLHSAIAHFIIDNPEEHYPDDRIMEMGWIKVGGVPHIQYTKPPTQS